MLRLIIGLCMAFFLFSCKDEVDFRDEIQQIQLLTDKYDVGQIIQTLPDGHSTMTITNGKEEIIIMKWPLPVHKMMSQGLVPRFSPQIPPSDVIKLKTVTGLTDTKRAYKPEELEAIYEQAVEVMKVFVQKADEREEKNEPF